MTPITRVQVRTLFDYHDGHLIRRTGRGKVFKIGDRFGHVTSVGYVHGRISKKRFYEHQLVWLWIHGTLPTHLDHINGDKQDNRIENLREASAHENQCNRPGRRIKKYGCFKGVNWHRTRHYWCIVIGDHGRLREIARCDCEYDGATIYNFAALEHHKSFANYNEVPQLWLNGTCPVFCPTRSER